jgi:formylglycine-generating enzyme required for sulfatase activity
MTTEVTQGMFTALMSYNPITNSYGVGNDYPAYYVNWHMAADFANKVTQRHNSVNGTALQQCYSCSSSGTTSVSCTEAVNPYQCSGYVLPTEAEWEYAARSGTQYDFWTPDGGGNYSVYACNGTETIQDGVSNPLLSEYAWYCGNASSSQEVGQKLPNGFGLYDMHGNLYEWTADWYGCNFPQTSTDPYCSTAGSSRVIRGGGWGGSPRAMRASIRNYTGPTVRGNYFGFRLGLHP